MIFVKCILHGSYTGMSSIQSYIFKHVPHLFDRGLVSPFRCRKQPEDGNIFLYMCISCIDAKFTDVLPQQVDEAHSSSATAVDSEVAVACNSEWHYGMQ